jgi:hypothetical protein
MHHRIALRLCLSWSLAIPAAYFAAGFLGNYHSSFPALFLFGLLAQVLSGLLIHLLFNQATQLLRQKPAELLLLSILFIALAGFFSSMYKAIRHYPVLFDPRYVLLESGQALPFLLGILAGLPCLAWLEILVDRNRFHLPSLTLAVGRIGPGMMLSGLFFCTYFLFASIFNQPAFDVDDIFFDTDGLLWRTRLTTEAYQDYYWRPVHPYVLLLLRPLITLVSFLLKGDKLAAAFLLTAFAGAMCVFLAWYFVRRLSGNAAYAAITASLLGASTAHLVFSSLIETYIFLAVLMLAFVVLLAVDGRMISLVLAGAASFGITITNFIPTAIVFLFVKRDVRRWLRYGVLVIVLSVTLTQLNNWIFPDSQPDIFDPSSYSGEAGNTFLPSLHRAGVIGRVMFLHSMVAPTPLILKEEIPFRKVWISKAEPLRVSEYAPGFADWVAVIWLALLILGGLLFLKNIKSADMRFQPAFIAILGFHFILHLQYGKDVFLYSTNWMYAIILFLAGAWREFAHRWWFQLILLVFLLLLLVNNSRLFHIMLGTSAMHIQ